MTVPGPLMIVAGEASADAHGAAMVRELSLLHPGLTTFGVGGQELAAAGTELLFDFSRAGVVGFSEVLPQLGRFYRAYRALLDEAQRRRPVGVVLCDLPDFNLLLAKKLRRLLPQLKIIYYISPQVWAWRPWRVKTIARRADAMLTLFPFEVDIYRRAGMDVEFVGHPLVDTAVPSADRATLRAEFGLSGDRLAIALLPGSRRAEIERYLPVMAEAATRLLAERDATFLLARAPTLRAELIDRQLGPARSNCQVVEGRARDVLFAADLAVCGSGTVTLEAALIGTPFIALGAVSWTSYVLFNLISNLPAFALPNVIAGRRIVPELRQAQANPDRLLAEIGDLLYHPANASKMREEFAQVKVALGEGGASRRAARAASKRLFGAAD